MQHIFYKIFLQGRKVGIFLQKLNVFVGGIDISSIFVENNLTVKDMEDLIKFLEDRPDIVVRKIEKALGLPNATIKVSAGYIASKHLDAVEAYLAANYGYKQGLVDLQQNEDNKGGKRVFATIHSKRLMGFKDGKLRYFDDQGLWRRLEDYGMIKDGMTGKKVLKEEWEPQSGELFKDRLGEFYIANNGTQVYISYNEDKEKRKVVEVPGEEARQGRLKKGRTKGVDLSV